MTLRKFISLVISVFYFKNEFTSFHWVGAAFVFVGTLAYAEIFSFLSKYQLTSKTKGDISSQNGVHSELSNGKQKKLN